MIEFVIKYWVQVLFGLMTGVCSYFIKHYRSLWKESQEHQKNKFWDDVKVELKADNKALLQEKEALLNSEDARLKQAITEVTESNASLLKAVLDVQRKQFKTDCRYLLEKKEEITFEEFEDLQEEYQIYKSLGGNGPGHNLFELVKDKYSFQMIQNRMQNIVAENNAAQQKEDAQQ